MVGYSDSKLKKLKGGKNKHSKKLSLSVLVLFIALTMTVGTALAAKKPNIVLVFLNNFDWEDGVFLVKGNEGDEFN